MLADIGQPADPNWNTSKLLRETISRFTLLPSDHPNPKKARESVEKTTRGVLQTIQGLSELRNQYGMASHGRDAFAARLDLRQATLVAQAADTIVAFLYRIHHDALTQTPGARILWRLIIPCGLPPQIGKPCAGRRCRGPSAWEAEG